MLRWRQVNGRTARVSFNWTHPLTLSTRQARCFSFHHVPYQLQWRMLNPLYYSSSAFKGANHVKIFQMEVNAWFDGTDRQSLPRKSPGFYELTVKLLACFTFMRVLHWVFIFSRRWSVATLASSASPTSQSSTVDLVLAPRTRHVSFL